MPNRAASRIKDLLNAPLATAYARVIVFAAPVVLAVGGYAAKHWIDGKIADAPAVVLVTKESAETLRRVSELENQNALDRQTAKAQSDTLVEVKADVKTVLATVNKMAGAMEVRTGIKLTGTEPAVGSVASTP